MHKMSVAKVRRHRNIRNAIANLVQVAVNERVEEIEEDLESIAEIAEEQQSDIDDENRVNIGEQPFLHEDLDNFHEEQLIGNEPEPVLDREDICYRLRKIYRDRGLTHEAVRDVAKLLNDLGHNIPRDPR
jgi:hypothetical protein